MKSNETIEQNKNSTFNRLKAETENTEMKEPRECDRGIEIIDVNI